ncbi:MAG: hypothetical protein R3E66_22680, partial [bacterium]
TRVDELHPGDVIPSAERGLLIVTALEWTSRIETVYNFGVDEYHTYFVGELGAWAHNCIIHSVDKAISAGLVRAGGGTERILRAVEARFTQAKPSNLKDAIQALGDGAGDAGQGLGIAREFTAERIVYQHGGGLESHVFADGTTRVIHAAGEKLVTVWEYAP